MPVEAWVHKFQDGLVLSIIILAILGFLISSISKGMPTMVGTLFPFFFWQLCRFVFTLETQVLTPNKTAEWPYLIRGTILESRCGVSQTFPAIKIRIRMNTMDMTYEKQKQNYIKFWFEATRKIKEWLASITLHLKETNCQ
jgi:hypothetical protein